VTERSGAFRDALHEVARSRPRATAVRDHDGRAVTYSALVDLARSLEALTARLVPGRATLMVDVSPTPDLLDLVRIVAAMLAARAVPVDAELTAPEAARTVAEIRADAFLTAGVRSAVAEAARVVRVPTISTSARRSIELALEPGRASDPDDSWAEHDDVCLAVPTSGTTGAPKLVLLTEENVAAAAVSVARLLELSPGDRLWSVMPLFHTHGLIGGVAATLLSGGTVVVPPPTALVAVEALAHARATWTTASPAHLSAFLRSAQRRAGPLSTLRFVRSASAPLPQTTADELAERLAVPIVRAYALTEMPGQVTSTRLDDDGDRRSVGWPVDSRVEIDRRTLAEDLDERSGEVVVGGRHLSPGYLGSPRRADGRFRTGDVGRWNERDELILVGRVGDVIRHGARDVWPAEVEAVLREHPAVRDVAVCGIPHATLGSEVVALVVWKDAALQPVSGLRAEAGTKLSRYKVPTRFLNAGELPKSAAGKILRRRLPEVASAAGRAAEAGGERGL
jgi:oxalate---CoA ligase